MKINEILKENLDSILQKKLKEIVHYFMVQGLDQVSLKQILTGININGLKIQGQDEKLKNDVIDYIVNISSGSKKWVKEIRDDIIYFDVEKGSTGVNKELKQQRKDDISDKATKKAKKNVGIDI